MEDIFESLFMKILNMSLTASYIIAAVLIMRLLLRKVPKKYSYALWAVAGFRLVCPVSFKSIFSIFALKPFALHVEDTAVSAQAAQIVHIPENIGFAAAPEVRTGLPVVDTVINESLPAATPYASVNPMQIWIFLGMLLWIVGIIVLLTVSAVSLFRLHRRLRTATLYGENIWQSENVHSPFIVGIFRPKIYIPYGLSERQLEHVLAHERCHIKRLDHIVRTLSYLVLCLHWFNPLVWLAFHLMGRDMELSCDERVLSRSGDKAEYSETLLSFASPRRFPTPTPLAFGESSVAQRIKNALKWHKPKVWVSAIALVCCLAVIAACAANPRTEDDGWEMKGSWVPVDCAYMTPVSSYFPFGGDNGYIYDIGEDGLCVYDHQNGQFRGGYASGYGWEKWFDFPYTAEEWEAMFPFWVEDGEKPLSGRLDDVEYMPLIGNDTGLPFVWDEHTEPDKFFLRDDDELWIVDTVKDSKGQRSVGSIYALQRQDSLGMASFEYPDGTSNEPGIEIVFDTGKASFDSVSATAYEGKVWANLNGERITLAGTSAEVPSYGSLFWCPVQNENERPEANGLTSGAVMRLTVDYGWSTTNCNIYIKYDYDEGIYELRPVGKGIYMSQSEDGKAILSIDVDYAHAKASDTDLAVTEISAASPWEFLSGLRYEQISGIILDGRVTGEHELLDIKNELPELLNSLDIHDLYVGRGSPWQYSLSLSVNDGTSGITLGYCGDFVELQLEGEAKEFYPADGGVWEIHNEALTEFMAQFDDYKTEFGILDGDPEKLDYIRLSEGGEHKILTAEDAQKAIELLLSAERKSVPYPTHSEAQTSKPMFIMSVFYTDGSGEDIFTTETGRTFLNITGTIGPEGDVGYVMATSDELYELLSRYAEKPELSAFTIDFTNNSDTEATELIMTFANNPEASFKNGGYSAQSSITRGGYTDSRDVEPMEKGKKYSHPFTVLSMGIVPSFETVYIAFELDGRDMGTYGFTRSELWGSTIDCVLRADGVFTVHLPGTNRLSYVYNVDTSPSLRLDFGEYDSLELSYEGGHIMFSADGEGWGDFIGSRVFWEPMDIRWSPMEPVDEENVLARRIDRAWIVFSTTKDGVTYGATINIEGEDGVYTLSAPGEWPGFAMGSDGRVVIVG